MLQRLREEALPETSQSCTILMLRCVNHPMFTDSVNPEVRPQGSKGIGPPVATPTVD